MPHDRRGKELQVGDIVMIPCVVREIHPTEYYCNVRVETLEGRRPDGLPESISAINTFVMYRANSLGDILNAE